MSARDRRLAWSVASALALVVVALTGGFLTGFRPEQLWWGAPIAAALGAALAATRLGYGTLAGWGLTAAVTATMLAYVAVSGGVHSPYVTYLGLLVVSAWLWTGPRGGAATTVIVAVALAGLGALGPAATAPYPTTRIDIAIAGGMAAMWLALLVRDLRGALDEREQAKVTLERSARAAQWDANARERFLAMVSHEFRTPLNVVLGYEEMLREEEDNPERIQDLERIHAAGQQLLGLIDDLIDLSTVDDAELPLSVEPLDLGPLIDEVGLVTRPLVRLRGNRWSCERPEELPAVAADPRRTYQILLNLISNAAKHTVDGRIELTARAVDDEVHVSVRDTGRGIDPAKVEGLFEPFAQLGEERAPGLGIGLALSQRWAGLMGGRIEVTSEVGRGSTFRLCLRRA